MNSLVKSMIQQANKTTTLNGDITNKSSQDALVDLFFHATRNSNIIDYFKKAYEQNKEESLSLAMWIRDVRGGSGERKLYRDILDYLAEVDGRSCNLLLNATPMIGRWDDILVVLSNEKAKPSVVKHAMELIKLGLSVKTTQRLCAKWMPRKGKIASALASFMFPTIESKLYRLKLWRKKVVELSKDVVEIKMCSKQWDDIEFNKVPSRAMKDYTKAFTRNAEGKFKKYKDGLLSGTSKVNASAIYPHEVYKLLQMGQTEIAEAMWLGLPNYMDNTNVLPVIDVSGSMTVKVSPKSDVSCLDVSVSLGAYISSKNTGLFKNLYTTFSTKPQLGYLESSSFYDMIKSIDTSNWGMTTDLVKAMGLLLELSIENKVEQHELPKYILVLSDMQFNSSNESLTKTSYNVIKNQYESVGYELPTVVFWNLNVTQNKPTPVTVNELGVVMVSGFSPAILKSVLSLNLDSMSPLGMMQHTINNDRYRLETYKKPLDRLAESW